MSEISATLLVEILTEELPPRALARLADAFAMFLSDHLVAEHYLPGGEIKTTVYATPRRLAVSIAGVQSVSAERAIERKGPSVAAGMKDGQPTQALLGFARSCAVEVADLQTMHDGKQECFVWRSVRPGEPLADRLPAMVHEALAALPVPKRMRWGSLDVEFVRPLHGLVMLHGETVVPGQVLGLTSSRHTRGHRFQSAGDIALTDADSYAATLREQGRVIASFDERKTFIRQQLQEKAGSLQVLQDDALLDEVTALVEWPAVYRGEFSADFLAVPQECLILSMKQHQKYFPLTDAAGRLQAAFLVVSNLRIDDPQHIVHGNERVLRARLSDARFFFEQDRRQTLASRVDRLASVVYHNQLGSQLDRVERLTACAAAIAISLGSDEGLAARAARLAKADLLTDMVGEFPELQGIMGRYYAGFDGEPAEVADAIAAHYLPRFAGDGLPQGPIAIAVALADKLDTLVGIFGIGQLPTGDKDPFGLRRAALGVLRIVLETPLSLSLRQLVAQAFAAFPSGRLDEAVKASVHEFLLDRLRNYLRERGHDIQAIEAVLARQSDRMDDAMRRLDALDRFRQLPEAPALAAANKRVQNLLKKTDASLPGVNESLFALPAEQALFASIIELRPRLQVWVADASYADALTAMAGLRSVVDDFFDQVMVMVDDVPVRNNRLALLHELGNLLNSVADIGML